MKQSASGGKARAGRAWSLACMALMLWLFLPPAAGADKGIVGSWSGTVSAGEFTFGASVTFSAGGSYSIRAGGLSSSGSYSASGSSITLRPSSPPGFSATTMSLSFSGDGSRATISGTINGLRGTLSLKRRAEAARKDPAFARWQAQTDTAVITLELYEGGWAWWHEGYEKGRNTLLLQRIREGILSGSLSDTAQILALIEAEPLEMEAGGRLSLNGESLSIAPFGPGEAGLPAFWADARDAETGTVSFSAGVRDDGLVLASGAKELVFSRLGDTPRLPARPLFLREVELGPGDGGEPVKRLQGRLIALGLLSGGADGEYGNATRDAVKAFEALNALPQDGRADREALRLLYAEPAE